MTTWRCPVCNTRMRTESDYRNGRHRECENAKLNSEDLEALAPWLNPRPHLDTHPRAEIGGS